MDLSGTWIGTLTYGKRYGANAGKTLDYEVKISMVDDNRFTGEKQDLRGTGLNPDIAKIQGVIKNGEINFVKQYPSYHYLYNNEHKIDRSVKGPKIYYHGVFVNDNGRFEGSWKITSWVFIFGLIPWRFSSAGEWNMKRFSKGENVRREEECLPSHIIEKAIRSGNEYSWKRNDFVEVLDAALDVGLGIIGGQMQFKLPDGTCEMYWHKYDTNDRIAGESWKEYCTRTRSECLKQFKAIPPNSELIKEGIECFNFLRQKKEAGIDMEQYIVFIIYFNDLETFLEDVN